MAMPLTVSCFSKIQIGFTFLVSAHPGSPGKRAVKRVCVVQPHFEIPAEIWQTKQAGVSDIATPRQPQTAQRGEARTDGTQRDVAHATRADVQLGQARHTAGQLNDETVTERAAAGHVQR